MLQTGTWIFGPPGTGKSSIVACLFYLMPQVEISCSKFNLFERSRLVGASLIIISDGEFIHFDASRLLKKNSWRRENIV